MVKTNNGGNPMTPSSILLKCLNIKKTIVEDTKFIEVKSKRHDEDYISNIIKMHVRPYKNTQCLCPKCRKRCPVYDHKAKHETYIRANNLNGVPIYLCYKATRIQCPIHGVLTEYLPWRDGNSRFTEGFNNEVAYMALTSPKSVVSQFFGINWRTVGNCIKAVHERIEPNITNRLHGLRKICVDETSDHKGHSYITVVYDMERNRVVWLHKDNGRSVFEEFCKLLTKEEQDAIEVVAGDGAKWIDSCCEEYFKNARRCIDPYHCISWCNEALDKTRNSVRAKANNDIEEAKKEFKKTEEEEKQSKKDLLKEIKEAEKQLSKLPTKGRPSNKRKELEIYLQQLNDQLDQLNDIDNRILVTEEEYLSAKEELSKMPKRGRRSKKKSKLITTVAIYEKCLESKNSLSDIHKKILEDLEQKAEVIQGSKYALGMNPENLSVQLQDKLSLIETQYPDLFLAYQLKEQLRAIIHMKSVFTARIEIDKWIEKAKATDLTHIVKLAEKIERRKEGILNSIELKANSSKSEATNTTIKSIIKTARGFRNRDNLFALIYLRCSDLVVPLNNRYQPSPELQQSLREIANQRKQKRVEAKISQIVKGEILPTQTA